MKKRLTIVSCLLALVMCLSLILTACAKVNMDDDTLGVLLNTLKTTYDGKSDSAGYTLPGSLDTTDAKGKPTTVYLSWEISGTTEIFVTKTADENGRFTVQFPATLDKAISYTLKVTLVNEKGKEYVDANKQVYTTTMSMTAAPATSGGGNQGGGTTPGGDSTGGDNQGGGTTPGGDSTGGQNPGDTTQPSGSQSNPYTVAQALQVGNALADGTFTDTAVYVKGIVVAGSTSQGATPYKGKSGDWKLHIADAANGTPTFFVFFATPASSITGDVNVGDTVLLYGYIEMFNGIVQMYGGGSSGKAMPQLVSLTPGTGGSTGGNTGGQTPGGNVDGEVTGNTVTIDFTKQGFAHEAAMTTLTSNGLTLTFAQGANASNAPRYWINENSGEGSLRMYGGNTLTISGGTITKVVITFATESNSQNNTISANTGTFTTDTWVGSTDSLTLTISGTSGHRRIASIAITVGGSDSTGGGTTTPGGDTTGGDNTPTTPGGNVDGEVTGNTVTIDFTKQGFDHEAAMTTFTSNGLTLAFSLGSNPNSNAPRYFVGEKGDSSVRMYGGNTLTISGKTITKVVFTYATGDGTNAILVDSGTFTTDTWVGSANSVKFTIDGTSKHRRIVSVAITFAD